MDKKIDFLRMNKGYAVSLLVISLFLSLLAGWYNDMEIREFGVTDENLEDQHLESLTMMAELTGEDRFARLLPSEAHKGLRLVHETEHSSEGYYVVENESPFYLKEVRFSVANNGSAETVVLKELIPPGGRSGRLDFQEEKETLLKRSFSVERVAFTDMVKEFSLRILSDRHRHISYEPVDEFDPRIRLVVPKIIVRSDSQKEAGKLAFQMDNITDYRILTYDLYLRNAETEEEDIVRFIDPIEGQSRSGEVESAISSDTVADLRPGYALISLEKAGRVHNLLYDFSSYRIIEAQRVGK